jgi:hypothetical protein
MPQLPSRFYTTLTVAGRNIGAFQTFSGGNVTATAVTDRPPGAEYPRAYGGEKEISEITIGRTFDRDRDSDELIAFLRSHMDENEATVSRKPMDANRNPFGKGRTWTCAITAVNEPDSDSNDTSGKPTLSIQLQPSGVS